MSAFRKLTSQPGVQPLFSLISSASSDSPFTRIFKRKKKVEAEKENEKNIHAQEIYPLSGTETELQTIGTNEIYLDSEFCEEGFGPNHKIFVERIGSCRRLRNLDSGRQLIVDELDDENVGIAILSPKSPATAEVESTMRRIPSETENEVLDNGFATGMSDCFCRYKRIPSKAAKQVEPRPLMTGYDPTYILKDLENCEEDETIDTDSIPASGTG